MEVFPFTMETAITITPVAEPVTRPASVGRSERGLTHLEAARVTAAPALRQQFTEKAATWLRLPEANNRRM